MHQNTDMLDSPSTDGTIPKLNPAYELLQRVQNALIAFIEIFTVIDGSHGQTLAEQSAAINDGWEPSRTWARAVRNALIWVDQLALPLRMTQSIHLDLADRSHTPDYSRIHVHMPSANGGAPYSGAYYPGWGDDYCPDLYRLYVMPGGARDILRTDAAGRMLPQAAFYVPDAHRTSQRRMSPGAFRATVEWCVRMAAGVLGVPAEALRRGGLRGTRFFRMSFVDHMVHRKSLGEVAALLGHRPSTLLRVYKRLGPCDRK